MQLSRGRTGDEFIYRCTLPWPQVLTVHKTLRLLFRSTDPWMCAVVVVQYGESSLEPTRRLPIICELPSPGISRRRLCQWSSPGPPELTLEANGGQGA